MEEEADVEAERFKAEAEALFKPFRAALDVEAVTEADWGVGGLEFLGVGGREGFIFEFELKLATCLGVGGREVLGVVGFELDWDALSVIGVERAILCLVWIRSRKDIGSESAGRKELDGNE